MIPPQLFVELQRRFAPVRSAGDREDTASESYSTASWFRDRSSVGWADLLKHPLSGKTWEMRNQAALASSTSFSFFLALDELATASATELPLTAEENRLFQEWKKSQSPAVFFLDSVDEAKIRKTDDFYRALDRFRDAIGGEGVSRATIIISSRTSEWLPAADGYEVRRRFPQRPAADQSGALGKNTDNEFPLVFQLLPLNKEMVRRYVSSRGLEDAERFLQALEGTHAWEFARRPADVDDLVAYWRERGSLGTLTEILEFVINQQLRKASDRDRTEILSLERAREGAGYLAAATIFCRVFAFRIPGDTFAPAASLDPLMCLPEGWRPEEARALLNRPLFDGASYGRIRFHHRRLSEFLAAKWLEVLMQRSCPIAELENILTKTRGDKRILRPSTAPLAAWLSTGSERWHHRVRAWILDAAPQALLRYGDPAQLTVESRRAVLKALQARAGTRDRLWWDEDNTILARLAHPDLGPDLDALLQSSASGHDLRELALELVKAGRITSCADAVLALAVENLSTGELFPAAARTLETVGNDASLQELAAKAANMAELGQRICVPLTTVLFPKYWGVADLVKALKKIPSINSEGFGWEYVLAQHLESTAKSIYGLEMLRAFAPTEKVDGASDLDDMNLPLRLPDAKLALAICRGLLARPRLSLEQEKAVAETLIAVGSRRHTRSFLDFEKVPELTEQHPNVRRYYFELASARVASKWAFEDPPLVNVSISYDAISPEAKDFSWLIEQIAKGESQEQRRRALRWSLQLLSQLRPSPIILRDIKTAAADSSELRTMIGRFLHPGLAAQARSFWYQRGRRYVNRWWWSQRWFNVSEYYKRLRLRWRLNRNRSKLAAGEFPVWIASLIQQAGPTHTQYIPMDWARLTTEYGLRIANAVRTGSKLCWRRYTPKLPHQKDVNEGATYGTIAGLAGVLAGWQDHDLDFAKLSPDDARQATHYALSELNGFAPWFCDLVTAQPSAVQAILSECISEEWKIAADNPRYNLTLSDLAWCGEFAWHLVRDPLMQTLSEGDPINDEILKYALIILIACTPAPANELAILASTRAREVAVETTRFQQWIAVWLQLDAIAAVEHLETRLPSSKNPYGTMVGICARLSGDFGDKEPLLANPSWLAPEAMRRFVPLVYRYVRREDDIRHPPGEAYSPGARDSAEHFRNALLERMANVLEPDVENVLRTFASDPLFENLRDYLQYLLERHIANRADGLPWRASDVPKFARDYERDPQTDSDLFRFGVQRLFDIKNWVETGEDSPREEVHPKHHEAGFRRWLQRRLNERGVCVVPQEWEIDQRARTDLRLAIPSTAPVSLELKFADEWPLKELLDGLEHQLVGTYLRDNRARYGIYVLAHFNSAHRWRSLDGASLIDFDEVVSAVTRKAESIVQSRNDVLGLSVIAMNFAPPTAASRSSVSSP